MTLHTIDHGDELMLQFGTSGKGHLSAKDALLCPKKSTSLCC